MSCSSAFLQQRGNGRARSLPLCVTEWEECASGLSSLCRRETERGGLRVWVSPLPVSRIFLHIPRTITAPPPPSPLWWQRRERCRSGSPAAGRCEAGEGFSLFRLRFPSLPFPEPSSLPTPPPPRHPFSSAGAAPPPLSHPVPSLPLPSPSPPCRTRSPCRNSSPRPMRITRRPPPPTSPPGWRSAGTPWRPSRR